MGLKLLEDEYTSKILKFDIEIEEKKKLLEMKA